MNELNWEHTCDYLNALFHAEGDGIFEIRCFDATGQEIRERLWIHPGTAPTFEQIHALHMQRRNIHFGPNPRRGEQGSDADVIEVRELWADLDVKSEAHPTGKHATLDDAFAALDRLPGNLYPSVVVNTGNGFQLHWLLREPIPVVNGTAGNVKQILKALERKLDGDPVSNLSRVLRLPGTWNWKNPAHPKLAQIIHVDPECRFGLEDFTAILSDDPDPDPDFDDDTSAPITFKAAGDLPKLSLGDLRLKGEMRTLVKNGFIQGGKYKSRSEADMAVVLVLRKESHTPDEIKAVYEKTKWRIGAKYREKLEKNGPPEAERYLALCIHKADWLLEHTQDANGPHLLWTPPGSPPDIGPVLDVVTETFPELYQLVLASLATVAAMLPSDVTNPPTLISEGVPGSGKTTVIDMVAGTPYLSYRSDKFTPKSFVSHAVNIGAERIEDVDLLPRIRHRALLTGELAPLFRGREEELIANFAILTAVLDGRGYVSDSGSWGQRGYTGDYLFSWLGATTPLESRTWEIMAQLGGRLLFYWLFTPVLSPEELRDCIQGPRSYKEKLAACCAVVHPFLLRLFQTYGRRDQERPFGITWNRQEDPVEITNQLAALADVGALGRSMMATWESEEGEPRFRPPIKEQPKRFIAQLYNLARGHALLFGRTQLTSEDLPLVTRVALDTMPLERRKLLRVLIGQRPGTIIETRKVTAKLECSAPTARKIMHALVRLELANRITLSAGDTEAMRIRLPEKYHWLCGQEIRDALNLETEGT